MYENDMTACLLRWRVGRSDGGGHGRVGLHSFCSRPRALQLGYFAHFQVPMHGVVILGRFSGDPAQAYLHFVWNVRKLAQQN
jgi:hypothetical protein